MWARSVSRAMAGVKKFKKVFAKYEKILSYMKGTKNQHEGKSTFGIKQRVKTTKG